jgi:hypothetical protein
MSKTTIVSMKGAGVAAYQNYTPPVKPNDFEGILRAIFQDVGNLERLVVDSGPAVSSARITEKK